MVGVHDLHASTIATGLPVLTAHVVVGDVCFTDGHAAQMLADLQACVADHFDVSVEHSTFQLEPHTTIPSTLRMTDLRAAVGWGRGTLTRPRRGAGPGVSMPGWQTWRARVRSDRLAMWGALIAVVAGGLSPGYGGAPACRPFHPLSLFGVHFDLVAEPSCGLGCPRQVSPPPMRDPLP